MDLDRLRSFLHIAETGSFSLTAEALHVTQSTISSRIKALEAELGQTLFHRGGGGTGLTRAGQELQPHAHRIVLAWEQARQQVALPPGYHSIFRLGGPVALWDDVIVRWVAWMRRNIPGVALHLEGSYSEVLLDQVSNGLLDAGLMYMPRHRAGIVVEPLLQEELVLVRHPGMTGPWHNNYVMIDWGPDFTAAHSQAFPGIPPPAVTAGLGVLGLRYILDLEASGYLPGVTAGTLIAAGQLVPVAGAPRFSRQVHIAYAAHPRDPALLQQALAGIRHLTAEHSGTVPGSVAS